MGSRQDEAEPQLLRGHHRGGPFRSPRHEGGTQERAFVDLQGISDPVPFSSVEGTVDHASGSHMDEQTRRSRELRGWVASLQNVSIDRGHRCHMHSVPGWRLALVLVSRQALTLWEGRD